MIFYSVADNSKQIYNYINILFHFYFYQYDDHEEVVLWMNTVGPYHNRQETYAYFSLPFCVGTKQSINHYHETLSEALQGVELEFSGYEIEFKGKIQFSYNFGPKNNKKFT